MTTGLPTGFRGDIQGLRAFAVLAVLIHHAFPSALPGGFTGVDIFFVISGYLIGKHILISLQDGSFSLADFYAKRARRIFPALAVMLFAIWIVGYFILVAPDFAALGKHMAASVVFSNNILLWTESGYFDAPALTKPLLHLWSLGVEEQFYLLAPCLLWAGLKLEGRPMAWITRLGAVSLLLTLFFSAIYPDSSFYLIHTRFWELAAGVALGAFELQKKAAQNAVNVGTPKGQKAANREGLLFSMVLIFATLLLLLGSSQGAWDRGTITSISGLILLLVGAAMVAIHSSHGGYGSVAHKHRCALLQRHPTLFAETFALLGFTILCLSALALSPSGWPGAQALWPILGSLLIVMAPATTVTNRLLACKPMAWIGGISYPLYLWHWPLLVVWRLVHPDAAAIEQIAPLGIAFILAWLTKSFIEDPVRVGRVAKNWLIFTPMALAGLLGWATLKNQGLPWRFPTDLGAIAAWSEPRMYENWRLGTCYHHPTDDRPFGDECNPPKRTGVPRILLWGDSHAGHLYPGLLSLKNSKEFDLAQWTTGNCPPTFTRIANEAEACPAKRAIAVQMLQQSPPDIVLISADWELYLKQKTAQEIVDAVGESVRRLKGFGVKRVIVFGPGPTWRTSLASDLFTYMVRTKSEKLPERLGHIAPEIWRLDAAMAAQAKASGADYFSVLNLLCNAEGCMTLGGRKTEKPDLLFFDRDHLSVTGSKLVIKAAQNVILISSAP